MHSGSESPLPAQPTLAAAAAPYAWFLAGAGSWFSAWGMQQVLFSWLVVGELGLGAERLGSAQFCLVLPSLAFALLGGATADRVDRRRLLVRLHACSSAVMLALGVAVAAGVLTFPLVVAYALSMGTLSAFAVPARDSLLNEVAGPNLMRAVVGATLVQFAATGLGSLAGGVASTVGLGGALALGAAFLATGVLATQRLPVAPKVALGTRGSPLGEIGDGLREVLHSPVLRPVLLLVVAVGLFFMGPYTVVLPILVRDYYRGGVGELSLLMMTFPIGSILGAFVLLARGRLRRKGLALALAQAIAALALLVMALGVPFELAFAAGVVWGLCGGIFMSAGRSVFQEVPPATHRARALSVYTLGFMGAGALGTPLAGFLAAWLGPIPTLALAGGAMLAFVACAWLWSGVRTVR